KLRTYFSNVCADFEAERVEMDGGPDHVHLLINYPPKLAISSLVNSLKGVSSRLLRRDRPDIAVRYYDKGVLWSPGYFVSSCILTYQLDLITTISVPNRISNVISIPLIIPSTSCNFPTLELHIVQTPDAKKSHVHF
ncbi:TPA: IS200/IS605 family transposase, partial [Escherichia coli]